MKGQNRHVGLGTDPVPPEVGARGYIRVVERGCGGTRDYWGDFDCSHGYGWTCDNCPWLNEKWEREAAANGGA